MTIESEPSQSANLYAPPVAPSEAPAAGVAVAGYKDQSTILLLVTVLLILQAVIGGFMGLSCLALIAAPGESALEFLVPLSARAALVDQLLYTLTIVPFAMFLVRANKNARLMGPVPSQFSPASMVWWFCVPFLNLVRPYQAVRAVWDASAPEGTGFIASGHVVGLWWAAWIIGGVSSRFTAILTVGADPLTNNLIGAMNDGLSVALCVFALRMLRNLHQRQQRRAREL